MTPVASRVFADLLERRTGQQLTQGRHWRIEAALAPLMRERDICSLDAFARSVSAARDESLPDLVVEALLNNETFFFRELPVFRLLTEHALPHLAAARVKQRRLRIWSAGCSTGQEAYSLAIAFAEAAEQWAGWAIEIVGTDISGAAIARARAGVYSQFEIQRGLSIHQLMQWFEPVGDNWRAIEPLRQAVRFHPHNLLDAPLAMHFDAILCRNVLLYFSPDVRRAAFDRLACAIAPDGLLALGAGEMVIGHSERFATDERHRGLYRPT